MKSIIFSGCLLFGTMLAMAQTGDSLPVQKSPRKAVLFSLVPGGGQLYNGKYIKAVAFFGAAVSLAVARNYGHDQAARENMSWWLVGLYLYNLVDAYVDAHLFRFDEELGEDIGPPNNSTTPSNP